MLNPDFSDMLSALSAENAEFLVVGVGDQTVAVMGREHLIKNKKAIGRPRDLADVAELERLAWDS